MRLDVIRSRPPTPPTCMASAPPFVFALDARWSSSRSYPVRCSLFAPCLLWPPFARGHEDTARGARSEVHRARIMRILRRRLFGPIAFSGYWSCPARIPILGAACLTFVPRAERALVRPIPISLAYPSALQARTCPAWWVGASVPVLSIFRSSALPSSFFLPAFFFLFLPSICPSSSLLDPSFAILADPFLSIHSLLQSSVPRGPRFIFLYPERTLDPSSEYIRTPPSATQVSVPALTSYAARARVSGGAVSRWRRRARGVAPLIPSMLVQMRGAVYSMHTASSRHRLAAGIQGLGLRC
ncbi:hypothetical protein B0H17DRAFT_507022 [Mycena rosella]|uniref:Uncharacterized protein n=1 Tax=Mycena rosella TaxID=1033263 RepID=A0AAD7C262_MYCRO|nr:hypothetical protein B0H17DRAFT_507022 [Mycena rosella]